MLKKRNFKKDNVVKVTFIAPDEAGAGSCELVGNFNEWQPIPMARHKEGDWRATVDLEPGREYEFGYRYDGERWRPDDAADDHCDNPFGGRNSVCRT